MTVAVTSVITSAMYKSCFGCKSKHCFAVPPSGYEPLCCGLLLHTFVANDYATVHRLQAPRHSTYIAHLRHTAVLTCVHTAQCSPALHHGSFSSVFSFESRGTGLAGVSGMHPSVAQVRVGALLLWRRPNSQLRRHPTGSTGFVRVEMRSL